MCCVVQLSFYGFGPSPCSGQLASSPASVSVKKSTSDDTDRERDESSQDSGIGVECTAQAGCHLPSAVFTDRTNVMDTFLSTGKLGINPRKAAVFKRSLSVPLSAVSHMLAFYITM